MVSKSAFAWLTLAICAAGPGQLAQAATPVYFRSDRGIAQASGLPEHFDDPQALRWRVELSPGHSTPTLWGDRLFLTTWTSSSNELGVLALDRKTGRRLWTDSITAEHVEQVHPATGSPASATPACDGERLYVFFGSSGLRCYDLSGQKLWEQRMGPFQDEYGASSSPVLVDNKVILCEDHDLGSFLIALDCHTGKILWKTPRPDAVRSYSTPAIWTHLDQTELLVAGALELAGYDLESGQKHWSVRGLARIVIPTPVISGDTVYMASWTPGGDPGRRIALDAWQTALAKWDRNHDGKLAKTEIDNPDVLDRFVRMDLDQSGDLDKAEWERHAAVFRQAQNAILAIKPAGEGEITDGAVLWKYQRGVPYVATPVVHAGVVWMVKDGGIVTRLNAADGTLLGDERLPGGGNYFASPVLGDGKVYFASENGSVSVVAEAADWRVSASHEFHEKIYATPVLSGNEVFIRTEKALYGFSSGGSPR